MEGGQSCAFALDFKFQGIGHKCENVFKAKEEKAVIEGQANSALSNSCHSPEGILFDEWMSRKWMLLATGFARVGGPFKSKSF